MARIEQAMWQALRSKFQYYGEFERIENAFGLGIPDVNFCVHGVEGWIELKARVSWPKKHDGPVTLPHYTMEQRAWAKRRHRAGGRVWWLLKVGEEYVLLKGIVAAELYGAAELPTKAELLRAAAYCCDDLSQQAVSGMLRTITDRTA